MTRIADTRRIGVRTGDRWLAAGAAVVIVGGTVSDVTSQGSAWVVGHLDAFGTSYLSNVLIWAGGVVSLRLRGQQGNGRLMLLAVSLGVFTNLGTNYLEAGPLLFVTDELSYAGSVLLVHLLLRWPYSALQTRAQRALVVVAWIVPAGFNLASDLVWDPAYTWPTRIWWPTIVRDDALFDVLDACASWSGGILSLVFVALIASRFVAASRPERLELVPVLTAVGLSVTGFILNLGAALHLWGALRLYVFSNLSLAAVPVALLIAVAVRRVEKALATVHLLEHGRNADPDEVVRSLRRALGDKHLQVTTWSADAGTYVDSEGTPAPDAEANRAIAYVPATDGSPLARIDLDRRLANRPDLTDSVVDAATGAFETMRLRTDLAARAEETTEVRAQLEAATIESAALSRALPGGLPEKLRADPSALGRIEHAVVTVLMSDVRGYSTIAERTDPSELAGRLQEHRAAMNDAVLAEGGTIMQYVGDAVMAVFGAPQPQADHASRAIRAAARMHAAQAEVNRGWVAAGADPFLLGIGVSTGPVATAVLGSADRYEYTIVGDTVNLAQRLEAQARPGGTTIASGATIDAAGAAADGYEALPALAVKGRQASVEAYRHAVAPPAGERPPALSLS